MLVWSIWNENSFLLQGGLSRHLAKVVAGAVSYLNAFKQAKEDSIVTWSLLIFQFV